MSDRPSGVDHAAPVRAGEELDAAALGDHLAEHLPALGRLTAIEQFPAGHSNLTYLLRFADGGEAVLRRPPFGAAVASGHDMAREHRVLTGLARVTPLVPRPLHLAADGETSPLGAPFFVMERVRGVVLRGQPGEPELAPTTRRAVTESAVDTLAAIHRLDPAAAGLDDLGRPEGYVERQVDGWTRRWTAARTEPVPAMDRLAAWLAEHRPPESGAAIVHNDFKLDNLVLDPADLPRVRAVLDWEMATVGDPLMDLGTSLGYWLDPGDPPVVAALGAGATLGAGGLDRRAVVERYAEASGRDVGDAVFYYVHGLFKIAVIVQQIYHRYRAGHTRDPRFAGLGEVVAALAAHAEQAVEHGRIDRLG